MMDEFVLIFGGGLGAGLAALLAVSLALQWFDRAASRNIDVEATYATMDETKRSPDEDAGFRSTRAAQLRLGALYALSAAVIFALVLRLVLALGIEGYAAAASLLITWGLLVGVPLAVVTLRRQRRLAVLEIASILQLIAHSDAAEVWEIRCTKPILGGDLFGPEEEDRFRMQLIRAESAPITLRTSGRITVADAGLERTVRKSALRQLRLHGWFVNELSATEVEFSRDWTLRDNTYIDIASMIAWLVAALGLPVGSVRLGRVAAA